MGTVVKNRWYGAHSRELSVAGRGLFSATWLLVLCVLTRCASADLYWDTNGATAGASSGTSAAGTFDATNWTADPAGTSATQAWVPGETAVFSAGSNANYTGSYYEVVLSGSSISVGGIKVEEGFPYLRAFGKTLTNANGALAIDTAANSLLQIEMLYSPTLGAITKNGDGQFSTIENQTTFAGKWVVNGGILSFGSDLTIGAVPAALVPDQITLNNGARILGAGGTKRGITLGSGGGGFGYDGTSSTSASWSGPITGSTGAPLVIDGHVNATLYNTNNNYDGDTLIQHGAKLTCGAAEIIPDTSTVQILNNSTLDLNGFSETVKTIVGSTGTIALSGSLTLQNPNGEVLGTTIATIGGKLIKNGTGAFTLNGLCSADLVLNSGKIGIGSNAALSSKITINGGTLANASTSVRMYSSNLLNAQFINGDFTVDDSLNAAPGRIELTGHPILNATRTITVDGSASLLLDDLRQSASGAGLTKAGTGTLDLRGGGAANAFSGPITVQGGRLQVDGISRFGNGSNPINLAGGSLSFTGYRDYWNGQIANPISATADSEIIAHDGGTLNFNNNSISGSAKITFRNEVSSALGTFYANLWGTGASFAPGPIEIANGPVAATVLGVGSGPTTRTTFNNEISGTGSLEVRGVPYSGPINGATVLNAANTYSGGTAVTYGVLLVNNTTGSGTGSGSVSVGSSGILAGFGTISGAVTNGGVIAPGENVGTLTVNSDVTFAANSRLAIELNGASADRLVVGGNLDLSAADFLDVTGSGSGPWVIATYSGSRAATFDNVTPGYLVDYTTPGQLVLSTIALPGDYNSDGMVDATDFTVWRKAPDAYSGAAGYNAWRANFGKTLGGATSATAVPEPIGTMLLCIATAALACQRPKSTPPAQPRF
jgi:autotransporter-associated beta strand protein